MGQAPSQQVSGPSNTYVPQKDPQQTPKPLSKQPRKQTPTPSPSLPLLPPQRDQDPEIIEPPVESQEAQPPVVDSAPQDPDLFDEEESYFSEPPPQQKS